MQEKIYGGQAWKNLNWGGETYYKKWCSKGTLILGHRLIEGGCLIDGKRYVLLNDFSLTFHVLMIAINSKWLHESDWLIQS